MDCHSFGLVWISSSWNSLGSIFPWLHPDHGSASDHTEADPWQSTPEQLDYPQPVSKRISIGLPINPYVRSQGKATATNNTQQIHTNDSDSAKTAKRSGQDGL